MRSLNYFRKTFLHLALFLALSATSAGNALAQERLGQQPDDGLDAMDAVAILRHILGERPLNYWQLIAADFNSTRTVTTVDVMGLKRHILGIDTVLHFGDPFVYAVVDHHWPDPRNPWAQPLPACGIGRVHDYCETEMLARQTDCIAIALGDVDNPLFSMNDTKTAPTSPARLTAFTDKVQGIAAGEEVVLDFILEHETALVAWEMGIGFDPGALALEEAIPGIETCYFGLGGASLGQIKALWISKPARAVPFWKEQPIMGLRFKAVRPISDLRSAIGIHKDFFRDVCYTDFGKRLPVVFDLLPDRPNAPYSWQPAIGHQVDVYEKTPGGPLRLDVWSPTGAMLEVSLTNDAGLSLASWQGEIGQGVKRLVFNREADWPTSGALHWQVRAGGEVLEGEWEMRID